MPISSPTSIAARMMIQHTFIWSQTLCGICINGYKERFCRGKILVTNQQHRDMKRTGCSAYEYNGVG